jgi:hypothetical protein
MSAQGPDIDPIFDVVVGKRRVFIDSDASGFTLYAAHDAVQSLVQDATSLPDADYVTLGTASPSMTSLALTAIGGSAEVVPIVRSAWAVFARSVLNGESWPDFTTMLEARFGYHATKDNPRTQVPALWSWLVAPFSCPDAHRVHLYSDAGLYVANGALIHLFSSRAHANRVEKNLARFGVFSTRVPCLRCYLAGAAQTLGRSKVRGALLDSQWNVSFYCCDEHGDSAPYHFAISDLQAHHTYWLIGCEHDGGPVWAPVVWEGLAFQNNCTLRRW